MRRRLPPPPTELPARFRCYDPAEWVDPADDSQWAGDRGRRRWMDAKLAWCSDNGVDVVEEIRRRLEARRRAVRAHWGGET